MKTLPNIKGLLLDLEGVIYMGDKLVDGALETIKKLKKNNISIRYLTNTTTAPKKSIIKKLKSFDLPVGESDIFSPSIGANIFLKEKNIKKIFLLANKLLEDDFENITIDNNSPEAIILGDIYKDFNWEKLNNAFQLITKNNAYIIALHKNKYCKRENNITLDLGPFVKALEYASSKKAVVIGKPEKKFFDLAIKDIKLPVDQVVMVGDDILSDIEGAKKNNIMAIQVKTGKYQKKDESHLFIQPNLRIDSIIDLPNCLKLE